MISVISTQASSFRAFGWVQDPSNLRSLCNVVAIFDETSNVHQALVSEVIPTLVRKEDGQEELIQAMSKRPLKIPYAKLVGTSIIPRSLSRCNAIVQATVKGQGRDFIGDWPADNFVRWAHAFGFIKYHYGDDSFEITPSGRTLVKVRNSEVEFPQTQKAERLSKEEEEVLTSAILAYPPAVRILSLLAKEDAHLTKFEIGRQLGFIGEGGFTSLPQSILLRSLATAEKEQRNKMRTDWDGSSDKYARMIGKWLEKLKLVEQVPKYYEVEVSKEMKKEMIGQAFRITAKGYMALNRCDGRSSHKRIPKNICFEMLATKGVDREFLRTRRAFILKYLYEKKEFVSLEEIENFLIEQGIRSNLQTIQDDIRGLINIGIGLEEKQQMFHLCDELNDFVIPVIKKQDQTGLEEVKDELRASLHYVSHEYLSLIDLAYDSKQNRLFEMKTMQLLTEECGFVGMHLGGTRKPDGVFYYKHESGGYGVIVDTKAYSKGYNLPIGQADEMERYIGENQTRDPKINPNEWWNNFSVEIQSFYFLFVAGHFKGNFKAQLERISRNRGVCGGVISVVELLKCAELIKSKNVLKKDLEHMIFQNDEICISRKEDAN